MEIKLIIDTKSLQDDIWELRGRLLDLVHITLNPNNKIVYEVRLLLPENDDEKEKVRDVTNKVIKVLKDILKKYEEHLNLL